MAMSRGRTRVLTHKQSALLTYLGSLPGAAIGRLKDLPKRIGSVTVTTLERDGYVTTSVRLTEKGRARANRIANHYLPKRDGEKPVRDPLKKRLGPIIQPRARDL